LDGDELYTEDYQINVPNQTQFLENIGGVTFGHKPSNERWSNKLDIDIEIPRMNTETNISRNANLLGRIGEANNNYAHSTKHLNSAKKSLFGVGDPDPEPNTHNDRLREVPTMSTNENLLVSWFEKGNTTEENPTAVVNTNQPKARKLSTHRNSDLAAALDLIASGDKSGMPSGSKKNSVIGIDKENTFKQINALFSREDSQSVPSLNQNPKREGRLVNNFLKKKIKDSDPRDKRSLVERCDILKIKMKPQILYPPIETFEPIKQKKYLLTDKDKINAKEKKHLFEQRLKNSIRQIESRYGAGEDDLLANKVESHAGPINTLLSQWVPISQRNSNLKDRVLELRRILQDDQIFLEDLLENDSGLYKNDGSTNQKTHGSNALGVDGSEIMRIRDFDDDSRHVAGESIS
jgi:hypothetical protein